MARANAKPRSAIKDVVSREYTINLHKVRLQTLSSKAFKTYLKLQT